MPKAKTKQTKIGLVLGGGGAKGFAHIGVYKVLYDAKVPIQAISGCSIGAMVAAGIAQGKSPEEILRVMGRLSELKDNVLELHSLDYGHGSLLSAKEEVQVLEELIPRDLTFSQLKIPLAVNAVDIEKGEEVTFTEGRVFDAVRASMSLPGIYPPVFYKDQLLIDGGILNNIPIKACKDLGAKKTIVVDLKSLYSSQNISGLIYHFYVQKDQEEEFDLKIRKNFLREALLKLSFPVHIMMRSLSIAGDQRTKDTLKKEKPKIIIRPKVDHFSMFDIKDFMQIYETGLKAAEKELSAIKEIL